MSRLGVLVLLVSFVPIARADWPHVRGPNYDGVSRETGLADTWPEDGPRRVWSRELGQGHSGIVVGEGRVFTQWQSAAGQYLLCLDPVTGDQLWQTRCDRPWQLHGAYPGPYATPTVHGGRVYFASPTGLVGCADATDGRIAWTVDIHDRFAGRGFSFGYAATPLVEDGRVYLPAGGPAASMVALDAASGATLWTSGGDPASYCPALPITWKGRRGIVGYLENNLVIADAATGDLWHRKRLSAGYDEHSAWPIYREPHLLLTSPFKNGASRLRLDGDPLTLTPDWISKHLSNDVASSVLVGDAVYGFDLKQLQASVHRPSRGEFRCLDWATGAVRWSTDRVGHSTVLAADGKLFLFSDSGTLVLARADAAAYEELGRVTLFEDEVCWTPPALSRGRLYVRSPSRLVCLGVGRGQDDAPSIVLPRPGGWRVDPSWLLSREREYPNDAPSPTEARLWLAACLLMMAAAGLVTAFFPRGAAPWVFAGALMVLGMLGTNLFSALADRCLFTWPLSLFAALYAATRAGLGGRWWSRLGILGLVLACGVYYLACRAVGMSVAWHYLFGMPFGLPLCAWAIAVESRQPRWAAVLVVLAFAAFFAGGEGLLLWRQIY